LANSIRAAIAEGRKIRGLHMTFAQVGVIELLALAGIDYVYLDGEHGAFEARDIEYACVAAERHGITPIARVPDPSHATIIRFLDRGIKGIVVPHVDTVDEAKAVIDAAYFGPIGNRSFGGNRPKFTAGIKDMPAHMAQCNADVCVSIMIETLGALAAAGDIAALPGIDYMSFGLNDLAQSLGHPGDTKHPEVVAAVEDASRRIRAAGKPVREDFISVGWINDIIMRGAREVFGEPRETLNEDAKA
jgi:2-keto-3-deoxy-L-rhamnonate aldolase RhmA